MASFSFTSDVNGRTYIEGQTYSRTYAASGFPVETVNIKFGSHNNGTPQGLIITADTISFKMSSPFMPPTETATIHIGDNIQSNDFVGDTITIEQLVGNDVFKIIPNKDFIVSNRSTVLAGKTSYSLNTSVEIANDIPSEPLVRDDIYSPLHP